MKKQNKKGRKKRYIKGFVYYTNDGLLKKTNPKKRRVVVINNNPDEMHVRRILSAGKGRNSRKGILIERYGDIPKQSVIENRTYRRDYRGRKLKEIYMRKSKTRLNKWDMKKICIK